MSCSITVPLLDGTPPEPPMPAPLDAVGPPATTPLEESSLVVVEFGLRGGDAVLPPVTCELPPVAPADVGLSNCGLLRSITQWMGIVLRAVRNKTKTKKILVSRL